MNTETSCDRHCTLAPRVRMSQYLLRHPEAPSCDRCLDELATEKTDYRPWGEFSIERAAGICVHCGLHTTVSAARRTTTLAEIAAQKYTADSRTTQTDSARLQTPARAIDLEVGEQRALLHTKIEDLENVKARIQRSIDVLRSELRALD